MSMKNPTPKRLTKSIRSDAIHPRDYLKYETRSSCEDCTHFDADAEKCTIGYNSTPHRRAEQERMYNLSGRIAICRFMEID